MRAIKGPSIWILLEFLVGAALALVFHFALHQPIVAYVVFGVGLLITLATWLIIDRIQLEIRTSNKIEGLLSEIKDTRFVEAARETVAECEHRLLELIKGRMRVGPDELSIIEIRSLQKTKHHAYAVCLGHPDEWDKQGWKNYLAENERAVQRGIHFTRILVLEKEAINDQAKRSVVQRHMQTGANVLVVWADETPHDLQRDFVIIDNEECLISEMLGTTKIIGGLITTDRDDIHEYLSVFEKLQIKAISAEQVLDLPQNSLQARRDNL